ncbi:hypothetical protein [Marinicella litoralis]|uniref:Uncharacterized protein n=1 Tax=Marinicella litoralis TaxID=644220 RepID=A0A4R6XDV4_9GAMM|nr:hypothetical protein [Marinicella litoralis]TDR17482.1 hypothetical protein C8D91_2541 [Marinicella litoralis]
MNLSAPKQVVFLIAVILAVLSVVSAKVTAIPVVTGHEYWFLVGGFVLLALGNLVKGI